jgi:hypothetical protein
MENLRTRSFYVTYLPLKILNLKYCNFFEKVFTEKSYHEQRFMTFKPNDQYHENEHGIVFLNDSILCKLVRLGMTNNVVIGSFYFLCTKNSVSIFRV